ncbi:hypothetical protein [Burkholderia sp. BE17]|nr:hypothetical protein [Burkholderia sp. BE17]
MIVAGTRSQDGLIATVCVIFASASSASVTGRTIHTWFTTPATTA